MPFTPRTLTPHLPLAFIAADAPRFEVSADMLRHHRFAHPHRGVYSHAPPPQTQFVEEIMRYRAESYLPLLREGEAFSHTTALLLYGCPLRTTAALHVTVQPAHNRARGKNVLGHRSLAPFSVARLRGELSCVPVATALTQSAPLLNFQELVIAIDFLVLPRGHHSCKSPLITHEDLEAALTARRSPGIGRLRAALRVARVGAESRMESIQHFELARMGIDDLEMQSHVFDTAGHWIGRFDLVDRARRRIMEYDGEQHRTDRQQYLKDERRLERARAAGYAVLRLHRENFHPAQVAVTRQLMCTFLGRTPRTLSPELERYFAECH
ncbi:hypothetical protein JOF28_002632 [Leucobacter exalbidus]|uniref:DUF559 domain-containing protein n=1 Tax=Leucobacter exalbidus TaxID=662960 RepID=A0A940PQR2_9MICO|nr:DUF559 domain-containing protein [Leucobacter exalbidus]MBP1327400.1 hypothetical protein [Leucobacter exalbidus]